MLYADQVWWSPSLHVGPYEGAMVCDSAMGQELQRAPGTAFQKGFGLNYSSRANLIALHLLYFSYRGDMMVFVRRLQGWYHQNTLHYLSADLI